MMQSHRRLIGVSVIAAIIGVGFIVAAFASDRWIHSSPVFVNDTFGNETKEAEITFGLFSGVSNIDYGFSARFNFLKIACDTSEQACAFVQSTDPLKDLIQEYTNQTDGSRQSMEWFGLFSFPVYVATLVMLVLAIIGGLLSIGFGIFNVFGRPIETITGPSGLYVWNILAFVFSISSIGTYLGLYFSQLKVNILTTKQLERFTSKDHTDLDFSFYFVVVAAVCFVLNLILLSLSGQKCSCHYSLTGEKEVDNGLTAIVVVSACEDL